MTPTTTPHSTSASSDQRRLRRIYLNDHRSGAAGALALIDRMLESNRGTPLGDTLTVVRAEVVEDAKELEAVMRRWGATANPVKMLAAKAGERLGRVKPNGRVRGYSPLSRLLELEALMGAIDVKRRLWETLQAVAGADRVGTVDVARLIRRAETQRARLQLHHEEAAASALGHGD